MNRFQGIRWQRASTAVPDLRMKQKWIDSWFVDQIFAFFIVNSLEAALVADLAYTWWGNQQSYPQFLLTTILLTIIALSNVAARWKIKNTCCFYILWYLSQMSLRSARRKTLMKMKYVDTDCFFELVARSGKTEKDFCNSAGVSSQVFYRLLHFGGPVRMPTLSKVASTLGVSVESLIERWQAGWSDLLSSQHDCQVFSSCDFRA